MVEASRVPAQPLFGVTRSRVQQARVLNNDQGGTSSGAAGVVELAQPPHLTIRRA